jgi:hypothetical protein
MRTLGGTIVVITATALMTASLATQVEAAPASRTKAYDGIWSVTINTVKGTCPTGLRYPARIDNGRVGQAYQDPNYTMGGYVLPSGVIGVTVAAGNQSASGHGRLKKIDGAGFWHTQDHQCAGTWTAARRD